MKVEERFLKYVSYHTTSNEENEGNIPSSPLEFVLANELKQELLSMGLEKVIVDEHCYVYGYLPPTPGLEHHKALGLIAHMDTAPDMTGENVKPQIIKNYSGEDVLLNGSGDLLQPDVFPDLLLQKGRTLITTDGTTLLGGDDKAGIAEILTAVEQILAEKLPHGPVWIGFTPDEEIGCGSDFFDLDYFKADYAFTVDGSYEGELCYENFNAAGAHIEINGTSIHPGYAKDIMINAISIGCELQSMLPNQETPEHTSEREGFYHLEHMSGDVSHTTMDYIIRDHDQSLFFKRQDTLRQIVDRLNQKYGEHTIQLTLSESYRNMIEILKDHQDILQAGLKAIANAGLTPVELPIRGGTDGARLSFMGLPCPNLGTGVYAEHGKYEHISVESMETVVCIIKELIQNPL